MGARGPRGGACSAAPVTIVIARSYGPARAILSAPASARALQAICQDFYDVFIGMRLYRDGQRHGRPSSMRRAIRKHMLYFGSRPGYQAAASGFASGIEFFP